MKITANLKVLLSANDVVIAESTDPALWQMIFAKISGLPTHSSIGSEENSTSSKEDTDSYYGASGGTAINKFAKALFVTVDELYGSCSPQMDAPYLHLNEHNWSALKKVTPERGPGTISSVAMAATLLCLWFKYADFKGKQPTVKDCQNVLRTINLREANPDRSISNTKWLQKRHGNISINPAEITTAIKVASLYVTKKRERNTD